MQSPNNFRESWVHNANCRLYRQARMSITTRPAAYTRPKKFAWKMKPSKCWRMKKLVDRVKVLRSTVTGERGTTLEMLNLTLKWRVEFLFGPPLFETHARILSSIFGSKLPESPRKKARVSSVLCPLNLQRHFHETICKKKKIQRRAATILNYARGWAIILENNLGVPKTK